MNTGGGFLSTDKTNSIFENSQQLGKYIRYAQEDRNAWHVDVVAHSMGGLITRHYIHQFMPQQSQDGRPQISHLVMLGTPNMGSPCADVMNTAFEFLGKDVEAVRQLRQDTVAEFNRVNVNRKGVKFSVLAGDPLPTMCKTVVWNDGVVPVSSAIWKVKDNARSTNLHTELTGTADFSSFVKPRLAIGPRGDHNPETSAIARQSSSSLGDIPRSYGMLFTSQGVEPNGAEPSDAVTFARVVTLEPKESKEIDVPVASAENFGITFMAVADVSVSLFDENGRLVGENMAKTPQAGQWFRSIFVDKPTTSAVWRIKIANTLDRETEAIITSWANVVK